MSSKSSESSVTQRKNWGIDIGGENCNLKGRAKKTERGERKTQLRTWRIILCVSLIHVSIIVLAGNYVVFACVPANIFKYILIRIFIATCNLAALIAHILQMRKLRLRRLTLSLIKLNVNH